MSKRVLVLAPRLDATFKPGHVPTMKKYDNLPPIRQHWNSFIRTLCDHHHSVGDTVFVYEKALWQFWPNDAKLFSYKADIIYVPHHEKHTFPLNLPDTEVRYYMQTVFPNFFTIDTQGWGAGSSWYPLEDFELMPVHKDYYSEMVKRIDTNESKFPQPKNQPIKAKSYCLFICQLPHDQTIQYHSDISVEWALKRTIEYCRMYDQQLIVKGHPVNPGAMKPLKEIVDAENAPYKVIWNDTHSIHDLLRSCKVAVTVNSGAGFEAILHRRPIVAFGRAEYDVVSYHPRILDRNYQDWDFSVIDYQKFFNAYLSLCYDHTDITTFAKL